MQISFEQAQTSEVESEVDIEFNCDLDLDLDFGSELDYGIDDPDARRIRSAFENRRIDRSRLSRLTRLTAQD